MAVPKRKPSKSKIRSRKRSHKSRLAAAKRCPECGSPHVPHRVCPSCGRYRGRQVVTIDAA
ncbi:MAG: 50S ribosomal protein L32 [Lentisphaerae bacterium]|nr:50S ribosomal protein L32 [Lentisphaerota bacterium]